MTITRCTRYFLAALLTAAALASPTAALPASAHPPLSPSKCATRLRIPPNTSLNEFTQVFGVSPARVIGITFECDGSKLPRPLRAYVNHGDWSRSLPDTVVLFPGKRVTSLGLSAG